MVVEGPPKASAPLARYPALPALLDLLAPGFVALLHDADRLDEREAVRRWLAEVPGLSSQFLPCEKGLAAVTRMA